MSSWYPIRWCKFEADGPWAEFHDTVGHSYASVDVWLEEADALFADPWQMGASSGRASVVNQGPREIPFTVVSLADTSADIDKLIEAASVSLAAGKPGKFSIALGESDEPFTIDGYIVTRGVTDYDKREGLQRRELALITAENYWHRRLGDALQGVAVTSGLGADLGMSAYGTEGSGVSFDVTVSGTTSQAYPFSNRYAVDVPDALAASVILMTSTHSLTWENYSGDIVNSAYEYRQGGAMGSGSYIFEPIPTAGTYSATGTGSPTLGGVAVFERYGAPQW